jgi:hypothetical protein
VRKAGDTELLLVGAKFSFRRKFWLRSYLGQAVEINFNASLSQRHKGRVARRALEELLEELGCSTFGRITDTVIPTKRGITS